MIVFAVVIYKKRLSDSSTVQTLSRCLGKFPALSHRVLLIDNSDAGFNRAPDTPGWDMHAFGTNVGLPRAYNHALQYCAQHGARHLVTLDQDSVVTEAYLTAVLEALPLLDGDTVALCPAIRAAGRIVSPYVFDRFGLPVYDAAGGALFAINSFTVYSTAYLRSVSGFDEHYWLDALDFSIFARIREQGRRVQRLDVTVDHDLSLLSGGMPAWRFANIVRYEACFLTEYCSALHAATGLARLARRVLLGQRYGLPLAAVMPNLRQMLQGAAEGLRRRGGHGKQGTVMEGLQ